MAISHCTQRAITFLLSARDPDGWWRDFDVAGPSDAWITGYVATALALSGNSEALSVARNAWRLLARRDPHRRGWGYHRRVPADSDTTAWALLLAQELDESHSIRVARGRRFLARHMLPDGGIATYSWHGPIARFTGIEDRFAGWCSSHTCVTATAGSLRTLPSRDRALQFLRDRQAPDGSWHAYWWHDPEFATAHAVEALATTREDHERVRKAAQWVATRIDDNGAVVTDIEPQGSPFATALALRVLVSAVGSGVAGDYELQLISRAARQLVETQRPNGAWRASARLRVPPPDLRNPEAFVGWGRDGRGPDSIGTIVCDKRAIHTTTAVLRSLVALRQLGDAELVRSALDTSKSGADI
jgi:squalene-hopene/tetraprenyl-beta-curcumene cyclase